MARGAERMVLIRERYTPSQVRSVKKNEMKPMHWEASARL